MSYNLSVAAAGDALTGTNIIDERFVAEAQRNIRGWDTGILDNSFFSSGASSENYDKTTNNKFIWALSYTNSSNIVVGRGMASCYGFDIKNEQDRQFSITPPVSGIKYVFIYLLWDFSNPQLRHASIDIWDNGANTNYSPQQDNLITQPNGQFVLPLYRLTIDSSGNVSGAITWSGLGTQGNITVGVAVNSNTVDARVYRGVAWSDMCRLCEESKTRKKKKRKKANRKAVPLR